MSDYYKCVTRGCEQVFFEPGGACPQCGHRQLTPSGFRKNAWIRLVAGMVVLGIIVPVNIVAVPVLLGSGEGLSDDVSAQGVFLVLSVFGCVTAFGLIMAIVSALDLIRRWRSRRLMRMILYTFAALYLVVLVIFALAPEFMPTMVRVVPAA